MNARQILLQRAKEAAEAVVLASDALRPESDEYVAQCGAFARALGRYRSVLVCVVGPCDFLLIFPTLAGRVT